MNIRELRNRKHALGATIVSRGSSFNKDRYTEKYDKEYTFTSMLYESDLLFSDCVVFLDRPQFGLPAMTLVLEDESVKHIKSDRTCYLNRAFRIRGDNKSDQAPKVQWPFRDTYETVNEAVDRLLGYGFKSLDEGSNRAPQLDGALVIVNYCIDGSYSNLSIVGEDTIEHEHRFDNLWQFENYLPKVSFLRAYRTLNDAIIYHDAERIGVMKINLILNDAKHEPECPDLSDFSDSMNLAHRLKHTCIRDEKLIIDWIPEEMKDADRSKPDYRLAIRPNEINLHRLSGHYVNDFSKKKCISGYINSNGILCFEQDMKVTMVDDKIVNVSKGCYFIESAAGMGLTYLPTYEKMINALKAPVSPKKSRLSGLTSVSNTTDYQKLGPAIKSRKITKVNFDDSGENNKARKPNRFR